MLFVFNAGDLGKYDTLQGRLQEEASRRRGQCMKSGEQRLIRRDWNPFSLFALSSSLSHSSQPILQADGDFLRQKICLMALIEAVFRRPRSQRAMPFQTIAEETKLPVVEVEHLVMKALR